MAPPPAQSRLPRRGPPPLEPPPPCLSRGAAEAGTKLFAHRSSQPPSSGESLAALHAEPISISPDSRRLGLVSCEHIVRPVAVGKLVFWIEHCPHDRRIADNGHVGRRLADPRFGRQLHVTAGS